ncbi:MAG TPA: DUF2807 domain-containing protein [Bacteroidia bacterium]|nr:DUF2807 domain-containing protein [Bacteroidia bacterium]
MIDVKGNETIITKEFPVSSFIRLHVAMSGITELIQSDEEKVVVEADENLMEFIEAGNAGRSLYVSTENKLRRPAFTQCHVKIYLRQVDVLYLRSNKGDVVCPDVITLTRPLEVTVQAVGDTTLALNAPAIKLVHQGTGNVTLKGKTAKLEMKNQGVGSISAKEMIADELIFKNQGTGEVELFAEKEITISNYGTGNVLYSGPAVLKDVKQYGTGLIKHVK